MPSDALVPVHAAGNQHEAALLQQLLLASGIGVVVQGESTRTDMGTEAGFSEILLLVPQSQLDDARALLTAQIEEEQKAAKGPRSIDGEVCPVHEQAAIGFCSRCGTFVCAGCGPLGDPPKCEDCVDREKPRTRTGTRITAYVMLAVFLGLPALIAVVARLFFGG